MISPNRFDLRREAWFWLTVIVWPLAVAWWLFVDYVWPWLWRAVAGVTIGVILALLWRVYYLGERPGEWLL